MQGQDREDTSRSAEEGSQQPDSQADRRTELRQRAEDLAAQVRTTADSLVSKIADPDPEQRMKNLAASSGEKTYSPTPSELKIPDKPIIHLAGQEVDFQELFANRPPGTDKVVQEYPLPDEWGMPVKAIVTITERGIEIITEPRGRRLESEIDPNNDVLTSTIYLKSFLSGKYLDGLPRGSEFFLAAYKFLSEQLKVNGEELKGFEGIWINGSIKDNYVAFEAARTDFFAAHPQRTAYEHWTQEVQDVEGKLRELSTAGDQGVSFYSNDRRLQELPLYNWDKLNDAVKAVFGSAEAFTAYQAIRREMNNVENDINEKAALSTWSGKMAQAIGFNRAKLIRRGPLAPQDSRVKPKETVAILFFSDQNS